MSKKVFNRLTFWCKENLTSLYCLSGMESLSYWNSWGNTLKALISCFISWLSLLGPDLSFIYSIVSFHVYINPTGNASFSIPFSPSRRECDNLASSQFRSVSSVLRSSQTACCSLSSSQNFRKLFNCFIISWIKCSLFVCDFKEKLVLRSSSTVINVQCLLCSIGSISAGSKVVVFLYTILQQNLFYVHQVR